MNEFLQGTLLVLMTMVMFLANVGLFFVLDYVVLDGGIANKIKKWVA